MEAHISPRPAATRPGLEASRLATTWSTPMRESANIQAGLSLDALGRSDEAVKRLQQIVAANPKDVDAWGALGSFANSRRLASSVVELSLACADRLITIRKLEPLQTTWQVTVDEGGPIQKLAPGRDPYEVQAAAFLDAVEAGDPTRVLSTYADALRTDRLTRAVVAATGRPG